MSSNSVACLILNRRYNLHAYRSLSLNRVEDKICHSVVALRLQGACLRCCSKVRWFFNRLIGGFFSQHRYPYSETASYSLLCINSAISDAISSIVCVAVLRATLSANEGLKSMTCCLVTLCHIGNKICSPVFCRVTSPSSS